VERPGSQALDRAVARILIIDDDPNASRRLASIVAELGHEPSIAGSWTDALRSFDPVRTDIVLMDAVMPNVDGFKLTRILRARAASYVPILFVTGLEDASAKELGASVGADDFLNKPVEPAQLELRLKAMLRIRRMTMDLEARSSELARLANYDELTGLRNRRNLDDNIQVELQRARRYRRPMSVLMLDVDHFKRVNDTHGHAAGDEVLTFLGGLLARITRAGDLSYRYGGEEFVVVAPETTTELACNLAERIRASFERESAGMSVGRQTASMGVAGTDLWRHQILPTTIFYAADVALYRAKEDGRNRVCAYEPAKETEDLLDECED
jgi:diguanylate cyclase (GGDEF)-like protein